MSFDGFVMRGLAHELNQVLKHARLDKIYQPLPRDLIWVLRAGGRNYRLLLSANPSVPRVYLDSTGASDNPAEPPMFCMLLRKQLEGARLLNIEQMGNDRILRFHFETRDELGDSLLRIVVVEIMGRHSNIILIDSKTDRILDSIVHVGKATSSFREVLPGRTYCLPPAQNKHNPFEADVTQVMQARTAASDLPFAKFLLGYFEGMSPVLAREIEFRAENGGEQQVLTEVLEEFRAHHYRPTLVIDPVGKMSGFSILPLTHLTGEKIGLSSVSELLEKYFSEKSRQDAVSQKAGDLARFAVAEIHKNEQKLLKFAQTKEQAVEAEQWRILGELLTANLHLISRGDSHITVTNFYSPEQEAIEIALDPYASPSENAQSYFKRYGKAKKSIPAIEQQMQIASEEIAYLEGILVQLDTASWTDIVQIREELTTEGYLKRARGRRMVDSKSTSKRKAIKPGTRVLQAKPVKFVSSEGVEIWVGKNNRQNDALTFKLSSPADTWLHTKTIPGSHVLIRGQEFSDVTLAEAAGLAAYFSKARESSQVPVDYTRVKNVWKPNGAKPGFVLYEKERTLFATPKLPGGASP